MKPPNNPSQIDPDTRRSIEIALAELGTVLIDADEAFMSRIKNWATSRGWTANTEPNGRLRLRA